MYTKCGVEKLNSHCFFWVRHPQTIVLYQRFSDYYFFLFTIKTNCMYCLQPKRIQIYYAHCIIIIIIVKMFLTIDVDTFSPIIICDVIIHILSDF